MRELTVLSSRVLLGPGLLHEAGALARESFSGKKALIAAGETAWGFYGAALCESLRAAGFEVHSCVYPSGEAEKTPATLLKLISALSDNEFSRSDLVFALGGGVTCDMAGLAAALYQRGLKCVLLPTTLLCMVDASVGGKTAVNLPAGKNQMGVFSPPALVLSDTETLSSLPTELMSEGWAEIIKAAFIADGPLHELLESETPETEQAVWEALQIKSRLVTADPFDRGERRLLNFGHTVGHAIERASEYSVRHGSAVAVGMAVMTRALCGEAALDTLLRLLRRFGLPERCGFSAEELFQAAVADKKRSDESITLVEPLRYGCCCLRQRDFSELKTLLETGL